MPFRSLAGRTLVIADADPDARAIFGTVLRHHGAVVHEADDGAECLRLARTVAPHVVLLELDLAGMSGTEVARSLHADRGPVPVLAVTADTRPASRAAALAAGCVGVLHKPVLPLELLATVVDLCTPTGATRARAAALRDRAVQARRVTAAIQARLGLAAPAAESPPDPPDAA